MGGLLVPWKIGSSTPVRAVSGPGVTTLLHPNTHSPTPEKTVHSYGSLSPPGVKLPQEWKAPDFAIPGSKLEMAVLNSWRKKLLKEI